MAHPSVGQIENLLGAAGNGCDNGIGIAQQQARQTRSDITRAAKQNEFPVPSAALAELPTDEALPTRMALVREVGDRLFIGFTVIVGFIAMRIFFFHMAYHHLDLFGVVRLGGFFCSTGS
ncbi:MAG: hypothetical protein P1U83_19730 [Roseovarius sp.]|nr:hypothetical protein [Roseovarius sp.]